MLKGFVAGYFSGIATAALFVVKTADILGSFKDLEDFVEWRAEREENTIDTTAREITPEA